jgi:hypothetical protein
MENRERSQDGRRMVGFGNTEEADHFQRFGYVFRIDVEVFGVAEADTENGEQTNELNPEEIVDTYIGAYKEIRGGTTTEYAEETKRRLAKEAVKNGSVLIDLSVKPESTNESALNDLEKCVKAIITADEPKGPTGGSWTNIDPSYL